MIDIDKAMNDPDSLLTDGEGREYASAVRTVDDIGDYRREEDDDNVLIYGPWLERGGSAFWVSTSGTGKSTSCMQFVHCASAGLPFCGLKPRGRLKFWVFQSEDSPRRVAQDRIDVRAELAEQYPDVDWQAVGRTVKFVSLPGKNGVAFLQGLDHLLEIAERKHEKPDVVVLNPLLAYIGGPITDGRYITPFLRGGDINGDRTRGLQALLEKHKVGVLIYHHTPKPPTEKEIDAWMKSPFPEYQGAGSSDLTNWGRSFVTMMRVSGHRNMVCVTAGKNGGELGWEMIGGAYRHYLAYSNGIGCSGKGRHAWRELDDAEYDLVIQKAKTENEKAADQVTDEVAAEIKRSGEAVGKSEFEKKFSGRWSRKQLRDAKSAIFASPAHYGLRVAQVLKGRAYIEFVGQADSIDKAQKLHGKEYQYARVMMDKQANNCPVELTVDHEDVPMDDETTLDPADSPIIEENDDGFPF